MKRLLFALVVLLVLGLAAGGCGSTKTVTVTTTTSSAAKTVQPQSLSALSSPPDLFVSPTGSDTAPCSQASPCASFDRANAVARPGNVVGVLAGKYPLQTMKLVAGRTTPNVIFEPYGGAAVVAGVVVGATTFNPPPCCLTFHGLTITGDPSKNITPVVIRGNNSGTADDITLDGNQIAVNQPINGPLVVAMSTVRLKIINNTEGPGCCGTDGNGVAKGSPVGIRIARGNATSALNKDTLIDGNLIQGLVRFCKYWPTSFGPCPQSDCPDSNICHADGIQVWASDGMTITNNRILDNEVQGIFADNTALNANWTVTGNRIRVVGGSVALSVSTKNGGMGGHWFVAFNTTPNLINFAGGWANTTLQTDLQLVANTGVLLMAGATGSNAGCSNRPSFVTVAYDYNAWRSIPGSTDSSSCSSTDKNNVSQSFVNSGPIPATDLRVGDPNWVGVNAVPQSVPGGCPVDQDGNASSKTNCSIGADQLAAPPPAATTTTATTSTTSSTTVPTTSTTVPLPTLPTTTTAPTTTVAAPPWSCSPDEQAFSAFWRSSVYHTTYVKSWRPEDTILRTYETTGPPLIAPPTSRMGKAWLAAIGMGCG